MNPIDRLPHMAPRRLAKASTALGLILLLVSGLPDRASGQVTNFSRDVARSIDDGLAWLDANGAFQNPSSCGEAAGLCALALLDKRESADIKARAQGYAYASRADRQRLDRIFTYIVGRSNRPFYSYRNGVAMMALSVYIRSGGPDAGARAALGLNFDQAAQNQGREGYWCYNNGSCPDASTTQTVTAGMAAARWVYDAHENGDANRLDALEGCVSRTRRAFEQDSTAGGFAGDLGHGYRPDRPGDVGHPPSYQMTASGLRCFLEGGADVNDPHAQANLRWLYYRYNYQTIEPHRNDWAQSYHYYLWSSARAYILLENSGVDAAAGNLHPRDLGTLPQGDAPVVNYRQLNIDPAAAPRIARFGNEGGGYYANGQESGWYFDYAYELMGNQNAGGEFISPSGTWNRYSAQAFALLVLERSLGGGCGDRDGDGLCDTDDNCPDAPDPTNVDQDDDRWGDACDNCPDIANRDQSADGDGDGIGDACDTCDDRVRAPEVCDGLDNDCDGSADEGAEAMPPGPCQTGEPGICGQGIWQCVDGQVECLGDVVPAFELCDGLDNDCDGDTDEACPAIDMGPPPDAGSVLDAGPPGEPLPDADGALDLDARPGDPAADGSALGRLAEVQGCVARPGRAPAQWWWLLLSAALIRRRGNRPPRRG